MKNDPYKKAGVDIKAGNDLVNKIKGDVAKTFDKNVYSNFEGRMIGLCCDNCKTKFEKDPSSYRSKISNFVPSKNFKNSMMAVNSLEIEKSEALDKISTKLRKVTSQLNSMGPEINLGWSVAQSEK